MTFDALETVFYTVAILVPGFIINSIVGSFVPPRKASEKHLLLRVLTFSSINYGLLSWLTTYLLFAPGAEENILLTSASWFLVILVAPVLLGILIGQSSQKEWLRRSLNLLGFSTTHPVPTSWDYLFSRQQRGWIIITLQDGTQVAGLFGENSFASSEADERDLYLEQLWRPASAEGKGWEKVEPERSILIGKDQVKYLEFLRMENFEDV